MKNIIQLALPIIFALSLMPTSPAEAVSARTNYKTYCVQCHGLAGNGKGVNTTAMTIMPKDHSDPKGMGALTDEGIFKAIKKGGPAVSRSVAMPPWGATLSDKEIKDLVSYLRELCKCKGSK